MNQTINTDQFRWLDSARDSQVWNRVLVGLHQELEPDDPHKVPPHYAATQYKYIYKIGVFRTSALVIIGNRETKDSPGYDYFSAYSYDLRGGSKGAIVTEPPRPPGTYPHSDLLWLFKVVKLAHFDRLPAPDVVFTYDDCSECEAEHFLASFEYEPGKGWVARQWDKAYSLYLEGDPSPGDDIVSADYLFKIKDWNGDGFDDVAVRRREITQIAKHRQKTDDSTTIYRVESGAFVGHAVKDPKVRERINAELCSGSKVSFCKQPR
ncbi:MAG TPA: hypothetical protein VIY69_15555 [Candidatus Acidoferrales bacterium]